MSYSINFIITCLLVVISMSGTNALPNTGTPSPADLPAFPGAEGYGMYTGGGRGGQVYFVTTTEDSKAPGSLRYAINQTGPRIIIFKISGTIKLNSGLEIKNGNLTIAGQTAPGDGICIRDYPVTIEADNVIIRFIRFRLGDETKTEADALGGRHRKNIIIDHCTMSWSTDECVSFYQNENFSLQWCLISESLRHSVHGKGAHGYGGIWGGRNASFHHNLLAHHDSRNPRLGEVSSDNYALTDRVDLRNNVIYNWQGNSAYGGEAMNVNIINCYYKPGPATTKTERIIAIDKNLEPGAAIYNTWGKFYIDGNFMEGSERATDDNWTYGVYKQFSAKYGDVPGNEKSSMRLLSPLDPFSVTTHTARKAYEKVLEFAGACLKRDPADTRIIQDVSTGTATYMTGGNGSVNGIIDTQAAVGGWPVLNSIAAPFDADNDGMPDSWEKNNDLDPDNPADAQLKTIDGIWPNLEIYLNSIVSGIVENQNEGQITVFSPPAFPGAEGFGANSTGGRGGRVIEVTNLNDSGLGSLREAVKAKGPRIVVFRVSGTINLKTILKVKNPCLTIAGQTAPGGGICLRGNELEIAADHVIVRYLRSRPGDEISRENHGFNIVAGRNIIVDHCSASWSTDETISAASNGKLGNVTVQWCIISESLNNSVHKKGAHGYGSLIRGGRGNGYSFHHNLYAHHSARNPRPGNYNNIRKDPEGLIFDFRNNVIYNWGGKYAGYNADGQNKLTSLTTMNFVGNYYLKGNNSEDNFAFQETTGCNKAFFSGNYMNGNLPADPWSLLIFRDFSGEQTEAYKQTSPVKVAPVTTDDALTAYKRVLDYAGAVFPERDIVDGRIINDVIHGTGKIIDSQNDVGGWPELKSATPPEDSDHDGMPDTWETKHGLNPNDNSDAVSKSLNSMVYTNIEVYINGLADIKERELN